MTMASKKMGNPPKNPHPKMAKKCPNCAKDKQDKQAPLSKPMTKKGMGC